MNARQKYYAERRAQRLARFQERLDEERGDGLLFSVIYSFDTDNNPRDCYPPAEQMRYWECMEDDGSADDCKHHRKFCAILNLRQFVAFVDKCELSPQDVETMGSIGAPGFGLACVPAISFDVDGWSRQWVTGSLYGNAYVTPFSPRWGHDRTIDFGKLRKAVIDYFETSDEDALAAFDPDHEAFAFRAKSDRRQMYLTFTDNH